MPQYCKHCKKQALYNKKGEKQPIYCGDHKPNDPDIVNVRAKQCLDCTSQPNFNYSDQPTGIYCSTHAKKEWLM